MRYLLRSMRLPHCARGPARCAICKQRAEGPPSWALLDVEPPDGDLVARPMVEVEGTLRVYDVVRVFESRAAADVWIEERGLRGRVQDG